MIQKRIHLFIKGKVQGVFFRARTKKQADSLGLKGWVRNLSDGSVEAVFEGTEENIEKVIEWCKEGPTGAIVTSIEAQPEEPTGEFKSFGIRY
jgi:acylphosphatase